MKKETFGQRLRQLREQNNLTLRELADKVNVSYSALGNYERDVREPNIAIIEKLSNLFEVDAGYLLGISPYKNPSNKLVVNDLGLSENSINIIKSIEDENLLNALSMMIEHPKFESLLSNFYRYRHDCKDKATTEKSFKDFYKDLSQYSKDFYGISDAAGYEYLLFQAVERQLEYILDRPKDIVYPNTKDTP